MTMGAAQLENIDIRYLDDFLNYFHFWQSRDGSAWLNWNIHKTTLTYPTNISSNPNSSKTHKSRPL
jgi:hypothetical protein